MKKEYESTIEEAVHTSLRCAELLGTLKPLKRFRLLVLSGVLLAVCVLVPDNQLKKIWIAVCSLVFAMVVLALLHRPMMRWGTRKYFGKVRGTAEPVPSEYELDELGLVFRQSGQELKFSWNNVREVNDTEDGVEVIFDPPGIAVIPKRIFEEPAELREWISFIKQHQEANG